MVSMYAASASSTRYRRAFAQRLFPTRTTPFSGEWPTAFYATAPFRNGLESSADYAVVTQKGLLLILYHPLDKRKASLPQRMYSSIHDSSFRFAVSSEIFG